MPIKPENRALYPKDWPAISKRIRFERAQGRCEFEVDNVRCTAMHGQPHPLTGSKVILTTAHLDHDPTNCADDNLKAGCQRCHNIYDAVFRATNRRATYLAKYPQMLLTLV